MTKEEKALSKMDTINKDEYPFIHYCESWLAVNRSRLKTSSSAKYLTDMENHILPFFGDKMPSEITSEEIDRFADLLLHEKKLSAKTARAILALLHSVFLHTEKRSGKKLSEPEIVYPRVPKKSIRILDESEELLFMQFLAKDMDLCKFGVYLALRTGLRIGEVCGLKWKDISLNARTLSIHQTVQRIRNADSQADARTSVILGTPKTESSCRMIPLMPDLTALCKRFAAEDPEAFLLTGTIHCMEPRKLQRRLRDYTEKCGIQEVHFHTLRHTFATRCIEAGFDMKTLSEILGHSNISVTMNQYVHPSLDKKRESMSRLKTPLCF